MVDTGSRARRRLANRRLPTVNGLAVTAPGNDIAAAWFPAVRDTSKVNAVFLHDGGKAFEEPRRIDDGDPMKRASVILLAGGSTTICWQEAAEHNAGFRVRCIFPNGKLGKFVTITSTQVDRVSGFLPIAGSGDDLVFV